MAQPSPAAFVDAQRRLSVFLDYEEPIYMSYSLSIVRASKMYSSPTVGAFWIPNDIDQKKSGSLNTQRCATENRGTKIQSR